jgi:hypothetical protein
MLSRFRKRPVFLCVLFLLLLVSAAKPLSARTVGDFSDLYEGERKYYGSEKEEKYRINAGLVEWEYWDSHDSFMALWLYRSTEYPKYSSLRLLPFWYQINSKTDNRERTFLPLLLYYHRLDGADDLTVSLPYYSHITSDKSERSLFWLFWWGNERPNARQEKSWFSMPLASWRCYDDEEGNIHEKTHRNPFYVMESHSEPGNDRYSWRAPFLPLTYHRVDKSGGHRNIFWLLDYSWDRKDDAETMKRFWLIPLAFWGRDRYLFLAPPLYMSWKETGILPGSGEPFELKKTTITPIFFSRQERGPDGAALSGSFWTPIIPLYYSGHDRDSGTHKNFLWAIDWARDAKGELERLWIIPLRFRGYGISGYHHILPPLYLSGYDEKSSYRHLLPLFLSGEDQDGSYFHFLPALAFHWKNRRARIENDNYLNPLFARFSASRVSADDKREGVSERFWWPVIPLYYSSTEMGQLRHRNILWALDQTWDRSGEPQHRWIIPLWFRGYGFSGYNHILPPLYLSGYDEKGSYRHLLPLFLSGRDENSSYFHLLPAATFTWKKQYAAGKEIRTEEKNCFGLPFNRFTTENVTPEGHRELMKERLWFPLVPVYYSSYHKDEGYHKNVLWLADWASGSDGNLERFWLLPLIFHETRPGGYRVYAPFYFRFRGNTMEQGTSFSLLHYHSWSGTRETTWAWPWFSSYNRENDHYYRHLLPVYCSWKSDESSGQLVLPLWFNYETKRRDIHINILGLSITSLTGPLTPSLGVGSYQGKWYLDADVSWLYDLVSVSTRVSMDKPQWFSSAEDMEYREAAKIASTDKADRATTFSKKKSFDRENSYSFYGFKLLFGWLAWESGDSKRHFRLLPLSWITWDKNSGDRIYVTPVFTYYNSTEDRKKYIVVFPLYGHQADHDSWTNAWLINAYWSSYDAGEKLHERDVLWPLINWYSSPKASGWRVFPLVWHSEKYNEDGTNRYRWISPLFYSRSLYKKTPDGEVNLERRMVNPLYYYSSFTGEMGGGRTVAVPLVPLYWYRSTGEVSVRQVKVQAERGAPESVKEEKSVAVNTKSFLLPLYYYSSSEGIGSDGRSEVKSRNLYGLPLLYYGSSEAGEGRDNRHDYSRLFIMGYHRYISPSYKKNSILFGLYSDEEFIPEKRKEYSLFWGLLNMDSRTDGRTYSRFFPLYSYSAERDSGEYRILLGLGGVRSWNKDSDSSVYGLAGLFHWSRYNEIKAVSDSGGYRFMPVRRTRSWLFPAWFYWNHGHEGRLWLLLGLGGVRSWYDNGDSSWYALAGLVHRGTYSSSLRLTRDGKSGIVPSAISRSWLFPLYYYRDEAPADGSADEARIYSLNILGLFGRYYDQAAKTGSSHFFPLWYRNSTPGYERLNILGFIDSAAREEKSYSRFMVFPFFMNFSDSRESSLYLPLLASWHREGPDWKSNLVLGTYWHSSPGYSRQNLWYVFDHEYQAAINMDSFKLFLGSFRADLSPQFRSYKLFYGLLGRYDNRPGTPDYNAELLLGLIHMRREGTVFSHSLQPLWYYKSDGDEWTFLSIAGLTYLHHDAEVNRDILLAGVGYYRHESIKEKKDFSLMLLGLGYYHNEDAAEGSERRMVLLGTLWNEVKRPERGYHSRGMLWGWLWDHEMESETDWSKFSILKGFIYKRVQDRGETRSSVMGVSI